jgi:hypothetical protein
MTLLSYDYRYRRCKRPRSSSMTLIRHVKTASFIAFIHAGSPELAVASAIMSSWIGQPASRPAHPILISYPIEITALSYK